MILPKKYQGLISEKINLNSCIIKIIIKIASGEVLDFTPGQFLMYEISEKIRRAYSIASLPGKEIELFIDLRPGGPASLFFKQVQLGTSCNYSAPYGLLNLKETTLDKVFFAGSTGVAPFRSMINSYLANPENHKAKLTLYFGAHQVEEFFLLDEFQELAGKFSNFQFIPVVGHAYLPFFDDQIDCLNKEFYLCGTPEMVNDCKKELWKRGVDRKLIYNEGY